MESLSWIFFCLSPFALFCSGDGNGIILCPLFIMLGFVFKYAGSNSSGTPTVVVKVKPQEFWEWHYKDRMRSTLAQKDTTNDSLMALKDEEARDWATAICGYHNAWVPPKDLQEQIARENGVVTGKMIRNKDKLQFGKHYLLRKKIEEETRIAKSMYEEGKITLDEYMKSCKSIDAMKKSLDLIEYSKGKIFFWSLMELERLFGVKDEDLVWRTVLSEGQRVKSTEWLDECIKRAEAESKVENRTNRILRDTEYQIKYGYKI